MIFPSIDLSNKPTPFLLTILYLTTFSHTHTTSALTITITTLSSPSSLQAQLQANEFLIRILLNHSFGFYIFFLLLLVQILIFLLLLLTLSPVCQSPIEESECWMDKVSVSAHFLPLFIFIFYSSRSNLLNLSLDNFIFIKFSPS